MQIDYKIVEAETPSELEGKVRALMLEGWVCQGGIQIIPDVESDGLDWSYQAMVKMDSNE